MPLLILGVVRQEHPPPSADAGGDALAVRLVESGDLAAAVTEIDDPEALTEEDAALHLDLLIALLRNGPVLPVSFGTVSPDEAAVRDEVLDAAAADLGRRLDAVDGLVETRLDVYFDESVAMRDVRESSPGIRALAADARAERAGLDTRIALGEAVAAELPGWREGQAAAVLPGLAAVAEDVVELETSDPLLQRWAFLVRTDRLADLDKAVATVRSSLATKAESMEYVGPLPVYSFMEQSAPASAPETPQKSAWGW